MTTRGGGHRTMKRARILPPRWRGADTMGMVAPVYYTADMVRALPEDVRHPGAARPIRRPARSGPNPRLDTGEGPPPGDRGAEPVDSPLRPLHQAAAVPGAPHPELLGCRRGGAPDRGLDAGRPISDRGAGAPGVAPCRCPRGVQSRAPRAVSADLTDGASSSMKRRVTVALICATVATLVPTSGAAQQLVLTVDVGKTEFFEDEPVYLLARLQNLGPDTAWVYSCGLASVDAFTISARRGDGQEVPVGGVSVNYVCSRPGPCRGMPVPAGVNLLSTIALQDIAGDGQNILRHLYAHHLAPDRYELRVEFRARGGALGTTPLAVQAAPIAFRIRTRTAAEEDEVRE